MKSPIKDQPLRNPGESLEKEMSKFFDDQVMVYFLASAVFFVAALLEWFRWFNDRPPSPILFSIVAMGVIGFSVWKFVKARKVMRSLKQGAIGEKAVGQYLERLRENGAQLFHDIPSKGFNLDHVVISDSGIYVIETKTYSKPDTGTSVIVYDGETVLINNTTRTGKPIIQVKAAAGWLSGMLEESTGRKFEIRPVVLFPGWFIEPTAEARSSDVWVLNPKALPAFIGNSMPRLSREELKMAAFHLSRYVRTYTD